MWAYYLTKYTVNWETCLYPPHESTGDILLVMLIRNQVLDHTMYKEHQHPS